MAESNVKEKNNFSRSRVNDALPHDLAVAVLGSVAGGVAGAVAAEGAKRVFDKLTPKDKPKPSPRKQKK